VIGSGAGSRAWTLRTGPPPFGGRNSFVVTIGIRPNVRAGGGGRPIAPLWGAGQSRLPVVEPDGLSRHAPRRALFGDSRANGGERIAGLCYGPWWRPGPRGRGPPGCAGAPGWPGARGARSMTAGARHQPQGLRSSTFSAKAISSGRPAPNRWCCAITVWGLTAKARNRARNPPGRRGCSMASHGRSLLILRAGPVGQSLTALAPRIWCSGARSSRWRAAGLTGPAIHPDQSATMEASCPALQAARAGCRRPLEPVARARRRGRLHGRSEPSHLAGAGPGGRGRAEKLAEQRKFKRRATFHFDAYWRLKGPPRGHQIGRPRAGRQISAGATFRPVLCRGRRADSYHVTGGGSRKTGNPHPRQFARHWPDVGAER